MNTHDLAAAPIPPQLASFVTTSSYCIFGTYLLKLGSFGKTPLSPNWLRSAMPVGHASWPVARLPGRLFASLPPHRFPRNWLRSHHLKPLHLWHLHSQIGFVREIAVSPKLASFRKITLRPSRKAWPATTSRFPPRSPTFPLHPVHATLILGTTAESMPWRQMGGLPGSP